MFIKNGDEVKIDSFFDEELSKEKKCNKCGKKIQNISICSEIKLVCACELDEVSDEK